MVLPSNSVFISCRNDDSAGWSATLANDLRSILGDAAVFIDDSTGIPLGTQWPDQISVALNQCRVFLPVIAPSWHQATNLNRLKELDDWVRQELITTHGRRSSVLCIPVFVNEAPILNPEQFSDDPEFQKIIADLMKDQGIRLDRGTEYWPAKIDSLITRIESHLDIKIPQFDHKLMADNTGQADFSAPPQSPAVRWLSANSAWVGTTTGGVAAIAAVIALYPIFFGSSEPDAASIVHVEDTTGDVHVARRDITNVTYIGDPDDEKIIASLLQSNQSLKAIIDKLLSKLPSDEQRPNKQTREEIRDAIIGIPELDIEASLIAQVEAALKKGDTDLAQALYKADAEAKSAAGEAQLQEAAQSYRRLGAFASLGDTPTALEAYKNAIEAWPEDFRAWNQLGILYSRTGQLELALKAFETVGQLADSTDESQYWAAVSLINLGHVHERRDELDEAVELYEKALPLYMQIGSKFGMAITYRDLGEVHEWRDELDEAVELYEKALALNMETGDKKGMAISYRRLGDVHERRNKLDEAVKLYEKALALDMETGDKLGMATSYHSLGDVHERRNDLDEAVELYEKALPLYMETGDKFYMAITYRDLGEVHERRDELDEAVELYEKALAIGIELDLTYFMAQIYSKLGRIYQTRGEFGLARSSWEQSIELFDAIKSPNAAKVRLWISELDAG